MLKIYYRHSKSKNKRKFFIHVYKYSMEYCQSYYECFTGKRDGSLKLLEVNNLLVRHAKLGFPYISHKN